MNLQQGQTPVLITVCMVALIAFEAPAARATIVLGAAASYTIISETGVPHIQLSNGTINGNVGVANPSGQLALGGSNFVNGNVDFAGTANVTNPANVHGTTSSNVNLTPAVSAFETLSSTSNTNAAGAPSVSLATGTTIDITAGKLVGNTYYFNLSGNQNVGSTITITGANAPPGSNVVFNVTGNLAFNGTVVNLTGGLNSGSVLWNVNGTNSISDSGNGNALTGILLDSAGPISLSGGGIFTGSIYGGGTQDLQISGGMSINGPAASGVPEPSTFAIAATLGVASFGYWVRRRKMKPAG